MQWRLDGRGTKQITSLSYVCPSNNRELAPRRKEVIFISDTDIPLGGSVEVTKLRWKKLFLRCVRMETQVSQPMKLSNSFSTKHCGTVA